MPEAEFETTEMRDRLEEMREQEKEVKALSGGWIRWVALTTAIMAVLAAVSALQASAFSDEALLNSNQAILAQTKASDTWTEYQANGLKVILRLQQAQILPNQPSDVASLRAEADRQMARQKTEMQTAQDLEKQRDHFRELSEHASLVHDHFAWSVAALQVGIGLASVAALTRRREIWALGSGFGLLGAGLLGWGFSGMA